MMNQLENFSSRHTTELDRKLGFDHGYEGKPVKFPECRAYVDGHRDGHQAKTDDFRAQNDQDCELMRGEMEEG